MKKSTFEQKVRELKELKNQMSVLDAQISALETELKNEMSKKEKYEYSGDGWRVSWNLTESFRFDQSAFKADHSKLFDKYQKQTQFRRFLVS